MEPDVRPNTWSTVADKTATSRTMIAAFGKIMVPIIFPLLGVRKEILGEIRGCTDSVDDGTGIEWPRYESGRSDQVVLWKFLLSFNRAMRIEFLAKKGTYSNNAVSAMGRSGLEPEDGDG